MREPENSLDRTYHYLLEEDFKFIAASTVNKMRDLSASSKCTIIGPNGHGMCLIGVIDRIPIQRKEYTT
jgi:hypothetical protein